MSIQLRRWSASAALVLLLAVLPAVPTSAEAGMPVLAGDTTIEAEGLAVISLAVPATTGVEPGSARLTLRDGTFGAVFIRSQDDPEPGFCEFCTLESFAVIPEVTRWSADKVFTIGGCSNDAGIAIPCELSAGELEIYFVSDGTLTFSAEFVDLSSTMNLVASQPVHGVLERLPTTSCPTNDCARMSVSHRVHSVGSTGPGQVLSFAYAELPDGELAPGVYRDQAGRQGIAGCTYPSFYEPTASPDPADHPVGCDFVPPPVGSGDATRNLNTFVVNGIGFNYIFQGVFSGTSEAHGPVYAGYTQQNHTVGDQQGKHGGWALWLDAVSP